MLTLEVLDDEMCIITLEVMKNDRQKEVLFVSFHCLFRWRHVLTLLALTLIVRAVALYRLEL